MFVLVFLVIVGTIGWAISPLTVRLEQQREMTALSAERKQVRQRNSDIRKKIVKLRRDPEYIELIARKELGLIKSDEEAFVVIEKDASPAAF